MPDTLAQRLREVTVHATVGVRARRRRDELMSAHHYLPFRTLIGRSQPVAGAFTSPGWGRSQTRVPPSPGVGVADGRVSSYRRRRLPPIPRAYRAPSTRLAFSRSSPVGPTYRYKVTGLTPSSAASSETGVSRFFIAA